MYRFCFVCLACICLALGTAVSAGAWGLPGESDTYFLGYETEVNMQYGGRSVESLVGLNCRLARLTFPIKEDYHIWAPLWEVPTGILASTMQHEINGHGSRAREFDLAPGYGIGLDLSFFTYINNAPASNEQVIYLSAAGTESNTVLSHNLVKDGLAAKRFRAAKYPLLYASKLDFSLYCFLTPKPRDSESDRKDFNKMYEEGNDIAIYLASRQAQRKNSNPVALWERDYSIDYHENLLQENWRDVQNTAVWHLLDPAAWSFLYPYIRGHAIQGETYIRPLMLELGGGYGLSIGTRGALGPSLVTRFLDLYLSTPVGLGTLYVRDLDSSVDRTYGLGAGLHNLELGKYARFSLQGDVWETPDSEEQLYEGSKGNISGELGFTTPLGLGMTAKLGWKSRGFLPGKPVGKGLYMGLGATYRF
ncbi:MAG: hypothetical protein ACOCZ2_01140 [Thermodesulfobacteriota bacterium]